MASKQFYMIPLIYIYFLAFVIEDLNPKETRQFNSGFVIKHSIKKLLSSVNL
jgi:hypothetical protein